MKRLLLCGLIALSFASRGSAAIGTSPDFPATEPQTVRRLGAGEPVKIVCFGDSVTGVYYHTGGRRAWCDLVGIALQRLYPQARVEMINAGISGNSTAHALRRMEADVLQHNPNLVFVMFGLNDVVRVPPDDFRANLRLIVQRAQQRGAEVILMTPNFVSPDDARRPIDRVADYAQIVRETGRELKVPVSDMFRAFQAVQAVDRRAWLRLMSDAIHPNARGHKLFAEEVVWTLTKRRVSLDELPPLQPGLPRLLARLQAREPVRIVAMKPYDAVVGPALHRLYPEAKIEVIAWDATGKSVTEIAEQARSFGWPKYREQPELPPPDLFVVAVPAEALAASEDQFFHSYTWIMNWSLSFGPPDWNLLVVLPSVAQPDQDQAQRAAESIALDVVLGQDVPWLQRASGDSTSAAELLSRKLAILLKTPGA